jgi:hypothetical protein
MEKVEEEEELGAAGTSTVEDKDKKEEIEA